MTLIKVRERISQINKHNCGGALFVKRVIKIITSAEHDLIEETTKQSILSFLRRILHRLDWNNRAVKTRVDISALDLAIMIDEIFQNENNFNSPVELKKIIQKLEEYKIEPKLTFHQITFQKNYRSPKGGYESIILEYDRWLQYMNVKEGFRIINVSRKIPTDDDTFAVISVDYEVLQF